MKSNCTRAIRTHLASLDKAAHKTCEQGMVHAISVIGRHKYTSGTLVEIIEDFRKAIKFEIWQTYKNNPKLWSYIGDGLMEAKKAVRDLLERTTAKARGITLQQYYQEEGLIIECPELLEGGRE